MSVGQSAKLLVKRFQLLERVPQLGFLLIDLLRELVAALGQSLPFTGQAKDGLVQGSGEIAELHVVRIHVFLLNSFPKLKRNSFKSGKADYALTPFAAVYISITTRVGIREGQVRDVTESCTAKWKFALDKRPEN